MILLPAWYKSPEEFNLPKCLMPQDVSTQWNLTFNMLEFSLNNQEALNAITGDQRMELWTFELLEHEWTLAEQLQDVLEVNSAHFFFFFLGQTTNASVFQFRYLRMLHCFSPETCQTLPWSSLQWITLMRSSHCSLWIANMMFPFTHHLVLPKNSQLLLQYDRHYWGVQDCNGYVFNWFIY